MRYAIFDLASGRIHSVGEASANVADLLNGTPDVDGIILMDDATDLPDPATQMVAVAVDEHGVESHGIVGRPTFPAAFDKTVIVADGTDTATLSPVPPATRVRVNGAITVVDDGVLALTADTGAVYTIACSQWPYQDWSATITATPVES